ncbi:MAG: DNA polymerase III subunit gamma/tau [Lonepinella koalarum]|nr:DNA polymerase III subunit gamma/tau [Lonepinella koalarum]
MSYQVLARKWRPKNFSEVVGQEHILTALSNGLRENRLHHAYLFSGTRGVGKTSIARLFAKGLNCLQGVTADPCGECDHCKAVDEGRFIDLIEIDAASRTKVEDTRELLDNVQYKPVQGRYKVYLIDEVHMLSRNSFNALLKTLEEPPEYVKFLLATTDPQKLPMTILSRCLQFNLKALEQEQISRHLAKVLNQEHIPFEQSALEKLAKAAQGSLRDSLSLTDQAIAMSNANITSDVVNAMLGLLDEQQPIEIVQALHQGNGEKLMALVQTIAEKGSDWEQLLIEVGECLHHIAMQQLLPSPSQSDTQIGFLAKHISPEDVQFFYQTMLIGRKELAFSPNRRVGVEMTLLRALAFHPKQLKNAEFQARLAETAVKKADVLVDIPVVEPQTVKDKGGLAIVTQSVTTQNLDRQKENASPALNALQQLQKLRSQSTTQKKNTDLSVPVTELPIVSLQPQKQVHSDLIDRFANLATSIQTVEKHTESVTQMPSVSIPSENISRVQHLSEETAPENSNVFVNEEEENIQETEISAENYQWEWINPELANEEVGVRPSDIKQAILQEKTPEVIAKVIALAEQQDDWTKIVGALHLDQLRLVKQLALNAVLLEKNGNYLKLGLRSNQAHLNRENAQVSLQQALSDYYQHSIELDIVLEDSEQYQTPLEHRRVIYQQLSEQASLDLQQDPQLELLKRHFDAKLDLSSIRPV